MAKNFQIFVLLFVLIALAVCDANMDEFNAAKQQIRKTCQDKTKVSTDLLDDLSVGKFTEGNKDLKCYVGCAMEQMKSIKDGKLDTATALQMIDTAMPENLRDGAKKALNACSGQFDSITDSCELGWELVKCWKKEDPDFMFV